MTAGAARLELGIEAGEDLVGELGGDRAAGERAEGDDADQRALERADVRRRRGRRSARARRVDVADVVLGDALAQDRQARGAVGGRDVAHQAGLEALAQPVLERVHVAREAVGGEHELARRPGAAR